MKHTASRAGVLIFAVVPLCRVAVAGESDSRHRIAPAEAIGCLVARRSALASGAVHYHHRSMVLPQKSYNDLRLAFMSARRGGVPRGVATTARAIFARRGSRILAENRGAFYWNNATWRFTSEEYATGRATAQDAHQVATDITREDVAFDGKAVKALTNAPLQLVLFPAERSDKYPKIRELDSSLMPWEQAIDIGPPPDASEKHGVLILEIKNGAIVATHEYGIAVGYAPLSDRLTRSGDTEKETLYSYSGPGLDGIMTPSFVTKAKFRSGGSGVVVDAWFIDSWRRRVTAEDLMVHLPAEQYTYLDLRYGDEASPKVINPSLKDVETDTTRGWLLGASCVAVVLLAIAIVLRRLRG